MCKVTECNILQQKEFNVKIPLIRYIWKFINLLSARDAGLMFLTFK